MKKICSLPKTKKLLKKIVASKGNPSKLSKNPKHLGRRKFDLSLCLSYQLNVKYYLSLSQMFGASGHKTLMVCTLSVTFFSFRHVQYININHFGFHFHHIISIKVNITHRTINRNTTGKKHSFNMYAINHHILWTKPRVRWVLWGRKLLF